LASGHDFPAARGSLDAKLNPSPGDDQFRVNASFLLGQSSNGINPIAENVTITVGNISKTIPPASFTKNKQGCLSLMDSLMEPV
jgi:hypothetical protein